MVIIEKRVFRYTYVNHVYISDSVTSTEYDFAIQDSHNPSGKFASGAVVDMFERLVPFLGFSRCTPCECHLQRSATGGKDWARRVCLNQQTLLA